MFDINGKNAQTIAEKYADTFIRCSIKQSSKLINLDKKELYDARIVGWKQTTLIDPNEYIIVEVMPPLQTHYYLNQMMKYEGYVFTSKTPFEKDAYGKKIFIDEIEGPSKKYIKAFPHRCKDCGSPALELFQGLDLSLIHI